MWRVAGKCRFEFDVVSDLEDHAGLTWLEIGGADGFYQMAAGLHILCVERRGQFGVVQGKENAVRIAEPLGFIAHLAAKIDNYSRATCNRGVTNCGNSRRLGG